MYRDTHPAQKPNVTGKNCAIPSLYLDYFTGLSGQVQDRYLRRVTFTKLYCRAVRCQKYQQDLKNVSLKTILLLTVFFGLSISSFAQLEKLKPEPGSFSSLEVNSRYFSTVRKVLFDSLSINPKIRVIVMPPFSAEYLISIDSDHGVDYLIYRIAKRQIWDIFKPTNDKVGYSNFKMRFDPSIADKLQSLFLQAILNSRFSPLDGELDQTNYIFLTSKFGYGMIGGSISASTGTNKPGLIMLSGWLKDCAKQGQLLEINKMVAIINDLIKQTGQ